MTRRRRNKQALLGGILGIAFVLRPALATSEGPFDARRALATFETEPGVRVELVAAEPLVDSPCALAFDERGRLFVAENRGYPTGGTNGTAVGRVSLLEDTDGDGRMDRRADFATGLTFPNGVLPWSGGLIVTCAPDVFYFKDTDRDGRADVREVLLTGFATDKSTQLRVNAPVLGPDGWVWLASGLSGGKITSPKRPQQPALELKGDLRFQPDTGEFESVDGKAQYGQSFDDAGRRFGVFNRVQAQHFVLPSRLIARNPHLPSPGVLQDCPDLVVNTFMRGEGGAARIFPISPNVTTADSHAGYFTAACAVHVYRGDAMPSDYVGNVFSCDPTGNLVHRDRLEPAGATFAAKRVREGVEVLRSPDGWFRPVFLATGPDGALYVCDMYRKTIEHPEYLPEDVRKRTDFESGKGMGRIWRLSATNSQSSIRNSPLAITSVPDLIAQLSSPNGWRRDTAFRLLLERGPADASDSLSKLLPATPASEGDLRRLPRASMDARSGGPHCARIAALNLLAAYAGWPSLAPASTANNPPTRTFSAEMEDLTRILRRSTCDESPGVRETAWRLLGDASAPPPGIITALALHWADDPNPRVRFQCVLALGGWKGDAVLEALAQIGLRDGADRWARAAVLSGLNARVGEFLDVMLRPSELSLSPAFMAALGRLVGAAQSSDWLRGLGERERLGAAGPGADWKLAFWAGVAEAVRSRGKTSSSDGLVEGLGLRAAQVNGLHELAATTARDARLVPGERESAIAFLRLFGSEDDSAALLALLDAREPSEVETAAARALAQPGVLNASRKLLEPAIWNRLSPALRATVLTTLMNHSENFPVILDAIDAGALQTGALNNSQREQLKKAKDDAVRLRAEKRFASTVPGDRRQALDAARACLALKPAAAKGHEVFTRACAQCHRFEREGVAVGPDLFDIRRQPKEAILLHIVIPEAEIAPNFTSYTCDTKDGRTLTGLLVGETPGAITLRQAQAIEETVARSNVARLEASSLSLMPQELEKGMTVQELADLLAYLKGEKE